MSGQTRAKATHRRCRDVARPSPDVAAASSVRWLRPVLLAVVLAGSAVSLAACGPGPSDATTVLRGATGVTVVAADGAAHPGADGERIVVGDTVRTTVADSALVTGRRVTTLGPSTAVEITGRSHYLLDAGTLVLDHRHGPDARVDAGPVTVEHVGATAVRIERGFAVRVAVFDGGAADVTASERSMSVPALHEVDVPGASLPSASSPLALRDDALDTIAAPALVSTDRALDRRATGLDRGDGTTVPAALIRTLPAAPPATAVSERVLPVAIARADRSASLTDAYTRATALRTDGGSWGVVAALLDAKLEAVQQQLDDLLTGPGSVLALPAEETGDRGDSGVTALLAAAAPDTSGDTPDPGTTPQGVASTQAPGSGPAPAPTPTTTPLVQALVNTITGLLPPGRPSSPPPSASATPRPVPSSSGGLLGGVLGSLLGAG